MNNLRLHDCKCAIKSHHSLLHRRCILAETLFQFDDPDETKAEYWYKQRRIDPDFCERFQRFYQKICVLTSTYATLEAHWLQTYEPVLPKLKVPSSERYWFRRKWVDPNIKKNLRYYNYVLRAFRNIDISDNDSAIPIAEIASEAAVPDISELPSPITDEDVSLVDNIIIDCPNEQIHLIEESVEGYYSVDELPQIQCEFPTIAFRNSYNGRVRLLSPGGRVARWHRSPLIRHDPDLFLRLLIFNARHEFYYRDLAKSVCVIIAPEVDHIKLKNSGLKFVTEWRIPTSYTRFFVTSATHFIEYALDYCYFNGISFVGPNVNVTFNDQHPVELYEWWKTRIK